MTTKLTIVNRALTEIASRQPIVDFVSTSQGIYADTLYQPGVEFLMRQQDWEFCRTSVALVVAVGFVPPLQWPVAYRYPTDCVRVRQVVPAVWDPYDPQPVRWDVASAVISATAQRVILTDQAGASLVYTTNNVTEDEWDAIFQEQMVRFLGSMLAMPIGGRPDFAKVYLQQAGGIGQAGRDRDS